MVPFQPPIQHVPPMSTLLPNPLWVPALFTPSTVGSSYPRLSDTCAAPAPTCLWTPPFAYGLPIFYYFYLFIYLFLIVIIFIAFLPSHCGGSFPSQWSSSPSHCWAPPLLTVGSSVPLGSSLPQHGALSHHTQVRGSSPSSHGGPLPATTGAVFHPGCSALPLS